MSEKLEQGMKLVNAMLPADSELGKRLTALLRTTMTEAQRMITNAYPEDVITRVLVGRCFTILMMGMGAAGWKKFDVMIKKSDAKQKKAKTDANPAT